MRFFCYNHVCPDRFFFGRKGPSWGPWGPWGPDLGPHLGPKRPLDQNLMPLLGSFCGPWGQELGPQLGLWGPWVPDSLEWGPNRFVIIMYVPIDFFLVERALAGALGAPGAQI